MPVFICQVTLAIRLVVMVAAVALEEEISRLLMVYELQSVTSFDFNGTLSGTEMFHYESLQSFFI
jgi:hypothetical protein